jgi:hypothetical protein
MAFFQFKHKHDAEIRKMYLENYKKLDAICSEIKFKKYSPYHNINEIKLITHLFDVLREAELCFNYEIVNFITELKFEILKDLQTEQNKGFIWWVYELEKLKKLYRKQIIHDPFEPFFKLLLKLKQIIKFATKPPKEILDLVKELDEVETEIANKPS